MNILHHKSWHVYNKDNIEKVRKDEADAKEKAQEKQKRVILAESEARLTLLRKKANADLPPQPIAVKSTIEHVNLFHDLEQQKESTNEEHEKEKKEKDEKWERQVTMYLDKGAMKEDQPWYSKPEKKIDKYTDQHVFKSKRDEKSLLSAKKRKRDPIKLLADPLEYINDHMKKKEKKADHGKKYKSSSSNSSSRRYENDKDSSSSSSSRKNKSSSSSSTSIEELRAKRLEREHQEKIRTKELYLGPDLVQEEKELDERNRGYNSQFNRKDTLEAKQYRKGSSRHL